jgi:hypothetical protein
MRLHQNHPIPNIGAGDLQAQRWPRLAAQFHLHGSNPMSAVRKVRAAVYGMVQQRAATIALVEACSITGVGFLLMLPLLPWLQCHRHASGPKVQLETEKEVSSAGPLAAGPGKEPAISEQGGEEIHLVLHTHHFPFSTPRIV